jgi:poly-gamma-glutamate biosynthesis protein PgsC/CapC
MVLAVVLYEKSHLTTGSIVVPGFLGIQIFEPTLIVALMLNAWMCFVFVHRLMPRFILMNSKGKFHSLIAVSILLQLLWYLLSMIELPIAFAGHNMSELGYVIPGLIAHDMSRNGMVKTTANTLFASSIVGSLVFLTVTFFPSEALSEYHAPPTPMGFDLVLVLVLSTLGSLYLKTKTPMRNAGYVTAAYLVFFGKSLEILYLIGMSAAATWVLCCGILIPQMIIFGRRKFALVLITGATVTWTLANILPPLSVSINLELFDHPSYAGILLLIPGLIANEIERSTISSVTAGTCVVIAWILIVCGLYYEVRTFLRPEKIIPLLASLTGLLLLVASLSKLAVMQVRPTTIRYVREQSIESRR